MKRRCLKGGKGANEKKKKYRLKVVHNWPSKVHESGTKTKSKREGNCSDGTVV